MTLVISFYNIVTSVSPQFGNKSIDLFCDPWFTVLIHIDYWTFSPSDMLLITEL